jgi:hypothetical protein
MVNTIDFYIGKDSYAELEGQKFDLGCVEEIKFLSEEKKVKIFYKNEEAFRKAPEDIEHMIQKIENKQKILPQESYISCRGDYSKYLEDVGFLINLSKINKCSINYLIE